MATPCAPGATDELASAAAVDGARGVDAGSLLSVSSDGCGRAWSFKCETKTIPV